MTNESRLTGHNDFEEDEEWHSGSNSGEGLVVKYTDIGRKEHL
jgi:hypothetical protein